MYDHGPNLPRWPAYLFDFYNLKNISDNDHYIYKYTQVYVSSRPKLSYLYLYDSHIFSIPILYFDAALIYFDTSSSALVLNNQVCYSGIRY